jgi:hypothetical protein
MAISLRRPAPSNEADAPLLIDANAVLPLTITRQSFKMVTGRRLEKLQGHGRRRDRRGQGEIQGGAEPVARSAKDQAKAASAASGERSNTLSRALAAPVGLRLPCSQFRIVSIGTSIRSENSI